MRWRDCWRCRIVATEIAADGSSSAIMSARLPLLTLAIASVLISPVLSGQDLSQKPASATNVPFQQGSSSSSSPNFSAPIVFWTGSDSKAQVTIWENTPVRVISDTPLRAGHTREGSPVLFRVVEDVTVDHAVIVPRGATVHGVVVRSSKARRFGGGAELTLKLTSLDLAGKAIRSTATSSG